MTALDLFLQLHTLRVGLTPYPEGTLRYKAPKGTMAPALVDAMRQHKDGLHALVETFEERAAIMEYDGRIPRDKAERLAWACIQSAKTYVRCESRSAGDRSTAC
jgi:hypothetical protein